MIEKNINTAVVNTLIAIIIGIKTGRNIGDW